MEIQLPPDFPQSAVDQFDKLREKGLLFYFPSKGEVTNYQGFNFEFKISTSIAKKPVLSADAPERRGKGGPFVDPDPEFVVARPGPDHVVELSMHAMMRPHYVLHTRLFAPQTDDLDAGDWAATWAVMNAIDKSGSKPMMIYNCGYEGGASQGHKHVQVFTEPEPGFPLFPETALSLAGTAPSTSIIRHPDVPFEHFILPLIEPITPAYLLSIYQRLLAQVRRAHSEFTAAANGVLEVSNGNKQPIVNGANGTNGTNGKNESNGAHAANSITVNDIPSPLTASSAMRPSLSHRSTGNGTDGHLKPSSDDLTPSTFANNVIMTKRWMCLVPRRRGGKDGTGAGSLGMMGLLWLKSQREREHWSELGMTEHLVWMGLPRTD
ncbi:ap4a phosphorylase ii [Ophiostoma piceae UAMH 11346]|uniref:Ap4a phosphorylase ii n=1 Tax=Ophiostoma piceae (strain UAMH 11346) TaxID=1262450 RepID=S3C6L2_OPHP1|nr:ap4a phosphorylase ii [Ophiostoma piceae UAMH 11346]